MAIRRAFSGHSNLWRYLLKSNFKVKEIFLLFFVLRATKTLLDTNNKKSAISAIKISDDSI